MPAGGIAHIDGGGHAYMDLCPQKILANRLLLVRPDLLRA